MLPGTNLSRTLARTPNLDWICVDTEHGNMSDDSMHEAVAAIAACGVSPIVRVAEAQHWMIKRALDAGAHGIIVPLIETVEDAKKIVKYSKFPPDGNRGLGSPLSFEKFVVGRTGDIKEISMADYYRDSNKSLLVIVQIETASALQQVKEIAAVDGIDVLFVGPADLGNSIGHSMVTNGGKHPPQLDEAIDTINKAAHDAGKASAMYTGGGDEGKVYVQKGFNMVSVATDVALLKQYAAQQVTVASGK